jgi:hypothetical protein
MGICGEPLVKRFWKELKIFGEQQMVFSSLRGTACDGAETGEFGVPVPRAALSGIRANRSAGAADLADPKADRSPLTALPTLCFQHGEAEKGQNTDSAADERR